MESEMHDYDEKLEKFLKEAEVIAAYLQQQVRNGSIREALYTANIKRYLEALEALQHSSK
jgi:hypothetical protein